MKNLKIFVFLAFFAITFLSPVSNVFADTPGNVHHRKIKIDKKKEPVKVILDTSNRLDTAIIKDTTLIKDTVNNTELQGNLNFFELIQPQHLAIGGAVFAIVIFSFVILSKIRNKK
jgi:hypothetical protein